MKPTDPFDFDAADEEDYPVATNTKVTLPVAQDEIVIQRLEIIGRVKLGHGSENAIELAFNQIGKYLANHDDREGITIGFEAWGREFQVILSPDATLSTLDGK